MTTASGLPRIPTGEPRFKSRVGRAAAAPGIGQLANDLVRTGQGGPVMASRPSLIGGEQLDAIGGGDGA
jgi:hypothetical protein